MSANLSFRDAETPERGGFHFQSDPTVHAQERKLFVRPSRTNLLWICSGATVMRRASKVKGNSLEESAQSEPVRFSGSTALSESLARAVLDASPTLILVLDCGLTVQFANQQFYSIFGSDAKGTLGQHVYDIANGRLGVPGLRSELDSLSSGQSDRMDIKGVVPQGEHKVVQIAARRFAVQAGGEPYILIEIRDVTQQTRALEDLAICEDKYRTLVEAVQDGVWMINRARVTTSASAGMAAMLGTTPGLMVGEPFLKYVFEEDHERAADLVGEKMRSDREHFEFRLRRADGSWFWASVAGAPIRSANGETGGLLGTFRDITERKQAEEAVARQADELARSNADLQHFAYVSSHDLREPLRTIRTYAQLLLRRYSGRLDSEADMFLEFIAAAADRMNNLVNDLLVFSRAVQRDGSAWSRTVNLTNSVDWAKKNLQTRISQAGALIHSTDLPVVIGDELQLVQLFQHLLSNALKFRRSEEPRIRVSAELRGSEWIIAVSDNGIGVPREHWERIFGIFKRLHGREISGTGIGLAICRKIAENHRGRIWVESEPGQGSTFFFALPADKPDESASA